LEKQAHLSPSVSVQSQNNQVHAVNSVATSPQQVPLFLAQPEHLQQGLQKTESASEAKILHAIELFGTFYSYVNIPLCTPTFLEFKESFSLYSLLEEKDESVK
jgi:hypothetical protein